MQKKQKTNKKKKKKTKKAKQNKKRHPQPREGGDEILSKLQVFHRETERERSITNSRWQLHRILANFIESSHYSGKSMVTDLPHQVIFNLYYTNQIHHSLLY